MLTAVRKTTPKAPRITAGRPVADWKRQLAGAIRSGEELLERLSLQAHIPELARDSHFGCLVTESYLQKIEPGNINDPLLRQVLPLLPEDDASAQQAGVHDPVGDLNAMAAPGLLHKYHGRALLVTTGACAIHCRYCFRRLYPYAQHAGLEKNINDILDYLAKHPEIDELILSGGDPLVLDNNKLRTLVTQLQAHKSLQTLRIHTRLPVVLPERIDEGLLELLHNTAANGLQVVMVIHANHARELDNAEEDALQRLHAAGIILLNQSVLLRGVNDSAEALSRLSKRLLQCHTLPYYLHLLDPVKGAMHFNVSEKDALRIHAELEKALPGYLLPKLVREIPGKHAKTAISRI